MTIEGVRVADILRAASQHRVVLAPETAGYLVLGLAEAMENAPRPIVPETVVLLIDGSGVRLQSSSRCHTSEGEVQLRALLKSLLQASSGRATALEIVGSRQPTGRVEAFLDELHSALVPLNREAARRALSRLARDVLAVPGCTALMVEKEPSTDKAGASTLLAAQARAGGSDSAIERSLESDPERPATGLKPRTADQLVQQFVASPPTTVARRLPAAKQRPRPASAERPVAQSPAARSGDPSPAPAACALDPSPAPAARSGDPSPAPAACALDPSPAPAAHAHPSPAPAAAGRQLGAAQGVTRSQRSPSRDLAPEPSERSSSRSRPPPLGRPIGRRSRAARIATMVLGGVVIGIGWYVFDWWALRGQNQNPSSNAASGIAPSAPCIASVLVDDIPIGAELLVRAGLSPGDLEQLVPGTRAEFVATADEFVPKRVVVPPGTRWESGPDGRPRFELAIQLEPKASVLSADAWPWPDIAVPADAIRGELRVVTMPPGAEVWSPRGTGPTISVEGLRCGSPVELLVVGWKSGKLSRQRLRVNANQLTPERGQRAVVAHVTGRL